MSEELGLVLHIVLHTVKIRYGHDDLRSCLHNFYLTRTGTTHYQWALSCTIVLRSLCWKSTASEKFLLSSCFLSASDVWNEPLLAGWASAAHNAEDNEYHRCNLNGPSAYVPEFVLLSQNPFPFLWRSGEQNQHSTVTRIDIVGHGGPHRRHLLALHQSPLWGA